MPSLRFTLKTAACLGLVALVLAACAQTQNHRATTQNPTDADHAATLTHYSWRIVQANDRTHRALPLALERSDLPPLTVNFTDGRIHFSGACNSMGTAYSADKQRIVSGIVIATQMLCNDHALMQRERGLSSLFGQQQLDYRITSDAAEPVLHLHNQNGDTLHLVGTPTAEFLYGKPDIVFMRVSNQTRACTGVAPMRCLLVKEVRYDENGIKTFEDADWKLFYDTIQGFEHHDDIVSVVRVKRYQRQESPADAGSYIYVQDMVVEQQRVD